MSESERRDRNEKVIRTGEHPAANASRPENEAEEREDTEANSPRTTTGKMTAPKFGSAGSGGAEFEGPLRKN